MKNVDKIRGNLFFNNNINFFNFVNIDTLMKKKILDLRNRVEIRKQMIDNQIISLDKHLKFIEKLSNDDNDFYWVVKQNGQLIGTVYFVEVDFDNKSGSFGLYVKPNLMGTGVGAMIIYNLLLFVFDSLNFKLLYGKVKIHNKRSLNTLLAFGFSKKDQIDGLVNIELQSSKWYQKKESIVKRIKILNKMMGVKNE